MNLLQGLVAALFLFSTLLLINLIQTLSLLVKPFSPKLFRRINRWAANTWWGWCTLGASMSGVKIILTGEDPPIGENSIVILNHQVMTDIPVLFFLAKAKGRLGDLKWFVKDILKYVPGVGWGMLFLDCLFIQRDWMADQEHIHRVFKKIIDHSIPSWVVTFAEGTRFTPAKLIQAQAYAKKQGLTPLRHLLMPRTKGFVASVQSLRGHIDAVYDLTIGYANGAPSLWKWMRGEVRSVHLHVRRFLKDTLPRDSEGITRWLLNLFREKDQLLDRFYREGIFKEDGDEIRRNAAPK